MIIGTGSYACRNVYRIKFTNNPCRMTNGKAFSLSYSHGRKGSGLFHAAARGSLSRVQKSGMFAIQY